MFFAQKTLQRIGIITKFDCRRGGIRGDRWSGARSGRGYAPASAQRGPIYMQLYFI